ncbi:WD repeat-containing protein 43 isoform X2 [Punica granatum]|uniref:WD repeat-containing protein 43 isoform X2 n=1 Tax=Punica granatum TaxID=22663 RepID=A0A6P8C4Q9_PUNGR|nr:WD repeat-containing protein 43 isoform X2 [Punica granatum]
MVITLPSSLLPALPLSLLLLMQIWSTKDQTFLTEWEPSDGDDDISYTCLALTVKMKKRRKQSTCMLAVGTSDGKVFVVDALTRQTKWTSNESHLSGLAGLSFVGGENSLYAVGTDGKVVLMNSENGEVIRNFKAAERPISSVAFSRDWKVLALNDGEVRLVSLESEQELLKFSDDMGRLYDVSVSDDAKSIVTSGRKNKYLQVWRCDASCTLGKPTKIKVKANAAETTVENRETAEKNLSSIIAAKFHLEVDESMAVLIAHGSDDSPQFNLVNVSNIGDNITVTAADGARDNQEVEVPVDEAPTQDVKSKKKRAASDPDISTENAVGQKESFDGGLVEDDLNEPTMGEKLEKLNLLNDREKLHNEKQGPSPLAQPPSADSVNVLLRQALRADDRALLLECLYTQDEKVIANSISLLGPSDVRKLLQYLISVVQSRGAVVACALPWLRRLLLQHASGIISQESSFTSLNSLYQLIESRLSTFQSALRLSSCLDLLYAGVVDMGEDEEMVQPVIYEDKDDSEDEKSSEGDAMDTDRSSEEEEPTGVLSDGFGDAEIDEMSD